MPQRPQVRVISFCRYSPINNVLYLSYDLGLIESLIQIGLVRYARATCDEKNDHQMRIWQCEQSNMHELLIVLDQQI